MNENEFDADQWKAEMESPAFRHGEDVGHSLGLYEAYVEAQTAYNMGEIELWLDFNRPKSTEEWTEWYLKYGPTMHDDFKKRWEERDADN